MARAAVRAASAGRVMALGKKYRGIISSSITRSGTALFILYWKTLCLTVMADPLCLKRVEDISYHPGSIVDLPLEEDTLLVENIR